MPTAPQPGLWPSVLYDDAPAGLRFLVDALGFTQTAFHPGASEGTVTHAELVWPGGGGVMVSTRSEGKDAYLTPKGSGSIYLVCDDPDALFERAVAAGAEVIDAPYDADYGSRNAAVTDAEGNRWSFGTYAGEPLPD